MNHCEVPVMHNTRMKTNLSASLADQFLPESEGFQILQSFSAETKT